jgi:hypothetical protein
LTVFRNYMAAIHPEVPAPGKDRSNRPSDKTIGSV